MGVIQRPMFDFKMQYMRNNDIADLVTSLNRSRM